MFDKKEDGWFFQGSTEPVTILHESYFVNAWDGTRYTAEGTNWELFYKQALNLLIGNEITVKYKKSSSSDEFKQVTLKPAKLLVLEGTHIFMSPEVTQNLSTLINLKVFIDSDSDVRLSRRVYQDTQ